MMKVQQGAVMDVIDELWLQKFNSSDILQNRNNRLGWKTTRAAKCLAP